VPVGRLINAIMLGIVTYDANLVDHLQRPTMKKIIVVREPKEWNLGVKGFEVVSSKDYLTDPRFAACATCACSTWRAATVTRAAVTT
jgi:hypothetical protein